MRELTVDTPWSPKSKLAEANTPQSGANIRLSDPGHKLVFFVKRDNHSDAPTLKILRKTDRFLPNCDVNRDQTVIHERTPSVRQWVRVTDTALAKTSNAIAAMIEALSEQLITLDELRARMPDLRARETNLRNQIHALNNQTADREAVSKPPMTPREGDPRRWDVSAGP